jgi:dipeptidase E
MTSNRILTLSSSRTGKSAYLETAIPLLKDFLGERSLKIAFIPFASADDDYEEYAATVRSALKDLHHSIDTVLPANARALIEASDVIMVGGGNTFKLIHDLYELSLMDLIRQKIQTGSPYIGWSAGSNIAGRGIGTTNDMPVIEPKSFVALGFFPFQINPHYINQKPEGFNGETRDQRLEEFCQINPGIPVVCLPEGTALRYQDRWLTFIGERAGVLFRKEPDGIIRQEILPGADLTNLMQKV